jgi:hypothetical protein
MAIESSRCALDQACGAAALSVEMARLSSNLQDCEQQIILLNRLLELMQGAASERAGHDGAAPEAMSA